MDSQAIDNVERFILSGLYLPRLTLDSSTLATIASAAEAPERLRQAAAMMYRIAYAPQTGAADLPQTPREVKRGRFTGGEALREVVAQYRRWIADDETGKTGQTFGIEMTRADVLGEREGEAAERLAEYAPQTPRGGACRGLATIDYLRAAKREAAADLDEAREALAMARKAYRKAKSKGEREGMKAAREACKAARERLSYVGGLFKHYRTSLTPRRWCAVVDKINAGTYVFRWNVETRADKARQARHGERAQLLILIGKLRQQLALAQAMGTDGGYLIDAIGRLASKAEALA